MKCSTVSFMYKFPLMSPFGLLLFLSPFGVLQFLYLPQTATAAAAKNKKVELDSLLPFCKEPISLSFLKN